MPFLISLILMIVVSIVIVFSKYDGSNDILINETNHLGDNFFKILSFINKWVLITPSGQIKHINFEDINNQNIIFHNSIIAGSSYNTFITLKSSNIIWQVIPNPSDNQNSCKILGDFRNNKLLMENPKFVEGYFGAYYCSILYNGVFETNALYFDGNDYAQTGTNSDGVFSCTYAYGTIINPPQSATLKIFAWGNIDYTRSTDLPIVCQTIKEGTAQDNITTFDQNETFTFYRSNDGSCTLKNATFNYSDIDAVDADNNNEIFVIEPTKNKAPTLEDKGTNEPLVIFASGTIDYTRSSDIPTVCKTITEATSEDNVTTTDYHESFTFYRSNDGSCTLKHDTFSYLDINSIDVDDDNELYVVEPTKNKAPTLSDK